MVLIGGLESRLGAGNEARERGTESGKQGETTDRGKGDSIAPPTQAASRVTEGFPGPPVRTQLIREAAGV